MAPMPETQKHMLPASYQGGMQVLEVRPGSPAASNGILSGDVLVGLNDFETLTSDNISWVLDRLTPRQPIKFYVVRGRETLFGHLQPTSN
jgi:serine protease Do